MAKKKVEEDEEITLEGLAEFDEDPLGINALNELAEERPPITDIRWHDFVMKHFEECETDEEGNPKVAGLRRVFKLLLGRRTTYSGGRVVQPPQRGPNGILEPVCCEYTIKYICDEGLEEGELPYEVTYTDAADVMEGNTDPQFRVHATATAMTKAEARCYRKALLLQNVVAAEETSKMGFEESGLDGAVTPHQKIIIEGLCTRAKRNVLDVINKVINNGRAVGERFISLDELPYDKAIKVIEYLNEVLRKEKNG